MVTHIFHAMFKKSMLFAMVLSGFFTPLLAVAAPDIVLVNGSIYNSEDARALAIQNGVITAIGGSVELLASIDDKTQVIDLNGQLLMPGFIDNHNHVFEAASEAGGNCELSASATLLELKSYLEYCQQQSQLKDWLMGYGFSLEMLLAHDTGQSPLDMLDSIFPDRPVILMEQTSHSMWVNSTALELAQISEDTPNPQGGVILRDEISGKLNGILLDSAGDAVMEVAWNSLNNQFEQSYQGLLVGLETAAEHGITTIGDGRLYWKRGWYEVWRHAEDQQTLTARVALRPWVYPNEEMTAQLKYLESIYSSDPTMNDRLIINQVKMYSDGIIINGTAKLLAPYLDTYLTNKPYGINYIPPQEMTNWLKALNDIGYSAHIHTIGDGAVRESLDAIEQVRQQGSNKPYTLTHVELVDKNDESRFNKLDVTADFQVGSDYVAYNDHAWAEAFIGAMRAHRLMNLKAIFDTGANVTLSSDWNVHDINPLMGIGNSLIMERSGLPTLEAAINAYTINAAKSLGIDHMTGSIAIGKSADLVLLDKDIRELAPEDIAKARVVMTMLQGEIVFSHAEN